MFQFFLEGGGDLPANLTLKKQEIGKKKAKALELTSENYFDPPLPSQELKTSSARRLDIWNHYNKFEKLNF